MKKKYLKPEAEYISLEAEDIITDVPGMDGGYDSSMPDDWE